MYINYMLWRYIGCNTELVPKELLGKTNKLSKDEIKEMLNSIPLEEGILEAPNVDSLVAQLMMQSIYPIKIHPCDKIDERLEKLRAYRAKVSMSTVKVSEDIIKVIPMQRSRRNKRPIILILLLIIVIVTGCVVWLT